MRLRLFSLALLCACVLPGFDCFGLDKRLSIHQYYCDTRGRHDGFPATRVSDVTQTSDGYIWFATQQGLVRYDGVSFKTYGGSDFPVDRQKPVHCLLPDSHGGLWFGLREGGFGYYDGTSFQFSTNKANISNLIQTHSGELLYVSGYELLRIKGMGTEVVTTFHSITSTLFEDSHGRIWIGTQDGKLLVWDGRTAEELPVERLRDGIASVIAEDREGRIWVGANIGLMCIDTDLNVHPLDNAPGMFSQVTDIFTDRAGVMWFGGVNAGLNQLKDGKFDTLKKDEGLADDSVTKIFEDREGSLWVTTQSGFTQLLDQKFPTFSTAQGLNVPDSRIIRSNPKGGFYVTGSGQLQSFDGSAFHAVLANQATPMPWITQFDVLRDGRIFFGDVAKNLGIVENNHLVANIQLDQTETFAAEDEHGICFGSGFALKRLEGNQPVPYPIDNPHGYSWPQNAAPMADGSFWLTYGPGTGVTLVRNGKMTVYKTSEGLVNNDVLSVFGDSDGSAWIATQAGISRFKDGTFQNCTSKNGLPSESIRSVIPDDRGRLWMNSPRGLISMTRASFDQLAAGQRNSLDCTLYYGSDAFQTTEMADQQHMEGCKTTDGRIWFLSAKGVMMIDPANLQTNLVAPPVYVSEASVNGVNVTSANHPQVQPGTGELSFHFTALSYIAPEKVRFRYKLEGYNSEWVESSGRREVFYTNLKPGQYHFSVTACNADGIWNTTPATYTVSIPPHFYQTAWFHGFIILSAGGLLLGLYRWKVRRLRHEQKQLQEAHDLLEEKVMERTAELAHSNESLRAQIEERIRMEKEVERIHNQLIGTSRRAGMAEVATSVLHDVGNVLNSANVTVNVLIEKTRQSKMSNLPRVADVLQEHAKEESFLITHEKGKRIPDFLKQLSEHWAKDQKEILSEFDSLRQNIEHINHIVSMQQNYARVQGVLEQVKVQDIVEDAVRLNQGALTRHNVQLLREFNATPEILVDRHKVLQILVNLITNAKQACSASDQAQRQVRLTVEQKDPQHVQICVIDNGIGIAAENLTRIFSQGFTTRPGGHGFGLHSAINSAREMKGAITVVSEGLGKGAQFILELPIKPASS